MPNHPTPPACARPWLRTLWLGIALLTAAASGSSVVAAPKNNKATAPAALDPYLWLEELRSPRTSAWVAAQNARTQALRAQDPAHEATYRKVLDIFNTRQHIPEVQQLGEHLYNFHTDAEHPRGLWRRTRMEDYRHAEPDWEPVLDLDALAAAENERWNWGGPVCREPAFDRCLLTLTRGGGDATVVREFDLRSKRFVEDRGFQLSEAKQGISWLDADTLLLARAEGEAGSTRSGYARQVRRWSRGSTSEQAPVVFEGQAQDLGVSASVSHTQGQRYELYRRILSFYKTETWLKLDGQLQRLAIPDDADIDFLGTQALVSLRSAWTVAGKTWPSGSLLVADLADLQAGRPAFSVLFEPTASRSLSGYTVLRDHLIVNSIEHVRNRATEWTRSASDGSWQARELSLPGLGSTRFSALDGERSNAYLMHYSDFLTPPSLLLGEGGSDARATLKTLPPLFDASGLEARQHFAVSKDGTRVPYFIVQRKDLKLDGRNRVLMYGYGGFESSQRPFYSASNGKAWMEAGGVYVLANIRGGGEYGPAWHEAAVRGHRQRAFDDFIAVAEDLVRRKITSPRHLGIEGYSNGGLLMGVMLTQRPDLFGAVLSHVPLLDMQRYSQLFAGASWLEEYGDPSKPEDWAYLSRYSPYHQLKKGRHYPAVLFSTSTRDDRVHPAHARKMVARMHSLGIPKVWLFENPEGGHAGAAGAEQFARIAAMEYRFLWTQLGGPQRD